MSVTSHQGLENFQNVEVDSILVIIIFLSLMKCKRFRLCTHAVKEFFYMLFLQKLWIAG